MTSDEFVTDDPDSLAIRESYEQMVATIRRNLDPNSNTVLIVDDEKAIRKKVARDVRGCAPGLVIFEAGNGEDGLRKLADIRKQYVNDPLLIITDLNMPVMDGWEFIKRLREDYEGAGKKSGIPVVVLSSTSGEKSVALVMKKTVHEGKSGYVPLVTVAKETCADGSRYDAAGDQGLLAWLDHFVNG